MRPVRISQELIVEDDGRFLCLAVDEVGGDAASRDVSHASALLIEDEVHALREACNLYLTRRGL